MEKYIIGFVVAAAVVFLVWSFKKEASGKGCKCSQTKDCCKDKEIKDQ